MKKTELKIGTATCLILHTVAGIAGITALFLPFNRDESPVSIIFNVLPSWIDTEDLPYIANLEPFPTYMAFFLPVFVFAAFVRWMISGLLSRPERAIAYSMSSMMSLSILYYIIEPLGPFLKASAIGPFGMNLAILILEHLAKTPFILPCLIISSILSLLLLFGFYIVIKKGKASSIASLEVILVIIILASLPSAPFILPLWLISSILSLPLLFGVYIVIKNLKNKGPKEASAVMAMQIAYLINALFLLISYLGEWQIGAYFVVVTSGAYLTLIVMTSVKFGVFRRRGESGSV